MWATWLHSSKSKVKIAKIPRFGKIYGKLALFRKYLVIYHFFSTRVSQNRVLNSTQVQWTRVPKWVANVALLTWNLCSYKSNVVLNIMEIEYFFTVLDLTKVEYLFFFFFFFLIVED